MWGNVGVACKFVSIISGTVALAALTGTNTRMAISMGIVFAVFQAIEHAVGPADAKAQSLSQRREYARLLATHSQRDDAALEAAYQALIADDSIIVNHGLRELAFNDVVREQGLDRSACFAERTLLNALS
jgi:pantothenate kinase type III